MGPSKIKVSWGFIYRMELSPLYASSLRTLRDVEDDKERLKKIDEIIRTIYTEVVHTAKSSKNQFYRHQLPYDDVDGSRFLETFYKVNMTDIIKNLHLKFPCCSIQYKILYGEDFHDVTGSEEHMFKYLHRSSIAPYIVIDWSHDVPFMSQ